MEEPLLFIPSPPIYYIEEVETSDERKMVDESTSVFEINRTERIKDAVIARQLHYFLLPQNRNARYLTFHLKNGGSLTGKIVDLIGINLVVKTSNGNITINGNDIDSIANANE